MSDPQGKSWSNSPYAPRISYNLYFREKTNFAGALISSILYGIVIVVSFKCMAALFNPAHRRGERIKWGLVSYTVVMFLVVTVQTATNLSLQSISYIDNREFPGIEGALPLGPIGYELFISPKAHNIVPNVMLFLSNWLADGLLLYRCYVIYSKNLWVIAFPCLMYLGSIAMSIILVYQTAELVGYPWSGLPYFSISLSLNVLLTLMIVIRLILHTRSVRTAMGISGIGGLSNAIITMLIESCALYAVSSLLVLGPWSAVNSSVEIFLPILAETQVIAPLLIIQRVANKSAFTSNSLVSGRMSSFKARSRGRSTDGSDGIPGGSPASSASEYGIDPGGPGVVGTETTVDLHQEKI